MAIQATRLYPFVPSGPRFDLAIEFFTALGFAVQWRHEGLAGLRLGGLTFCCKTSTCRSGKRTR